VTFSSTTSVVRSAAARRSPAVAPRPSAAASANSRLDKTTYFFYFASGGTLAEETRPSGATKVRYLNAADGQVLAEQRHDDDPVSGDPDQTTSVWVWLLRDPDGNVATELKETATGPLVSAQRAYDPYGSEDKVGSTFVQYLPIRMPNVYCWERRTDAQIGEAQVKCEDREHGRA